MGVAPSAPVVSVGLGGLFRRTLIHRENVALCLPLAELYSGSPARDISGHAHHGTYVGSGFTRGIPLGLPEGGICPRFAGAEYVEVPADAEDDDPALSLQDGAVCLAALIRPSSIDATLRAIIAKQVGSSAGNGYHLAIENGAIRFRLRAGGADIVNVTRGALSADTWYSIVALYTPDLPEARIYINGVQSGATVTTGGAELDYETANLRVGMFNDGAGGFLGDIAWVMVSREYDTALPAALQACRAWTVLGDVQQMPGIEIRQGISGARVHDLVAEPGTLTFELDNTHGGQAIGYYTPGHVNQLSGWQEGIPIKVEQTYSGVTYPLFTGRIDHLDFHVDTRGTKRVTVTAVDYMEFLRRALLGSVEAMTDVRSDDLIRRIVDECDIAPHGVSFGVGSETFPFALDVAAKTSLLTEIQRVCLSERGFCYVTADGTLVFEPRSQRQTDITFDTTWVNTMEGIEVERSRDAIINALRVTVYPRRVDTSPTTVLYALPTDATPPSIPPGETLRLQAEYSDPTQEGSPVGAINVQTPTFTLTDLFGVDRTSEGMVAFVGDPGGARATVDVTNHSSSTVTLSALEIRGRGVYRSAPYTIELTDPESVDEWGPRSETLDMVLVGDANVGHAIGTHIIASRGKPVTLASAVHLLGNKSHALMLDVLARQIGDRVGVTESTTALAATTGMHIQHVERHLGPGLIARATFTLSQPPTEELPQLWLMGVTGYSELGVSTYLGL